MLTARILARVSTKTVRLAKQGGQNRGYLNFQDPFFLCLNFAMLGVQSNFARLMEILRMI